MGQGLSMHGLKFGLWLQNVPQVNFLNIFEIWPQMTVWPCPCPQRFHSRAVLVQNVWFWLKMAIAFGQKVVNSPFPLLFWRFSLVLSCLHPLFHVETRHHRISPSWDKSTQHLYFNVFFIWKTYAHLLKQSCQCFLSTAKQKGKPHFLFFLRPPHVSHTKK